MAICCMTRNSNWGSITTEGWSEEGGERDVQVGGDMGKPMVDSCLYLVGTNAIL